LALETVQPVDIQDLHKVTPDVFLEMAGGILHSLSYQQVQLLLWHFPLMQHSHVRLQLLV
jgi:hypothetical protein